MPRKRMISPEFWSDQKIGRLSLTARLLYIGIWNFADDEGRFPADPQLLKSQIFPYDPKIQIRRAMAELEEEKRIIFYQFADCSFGFVRQWAVWQKIDKPQPSNLPPPPTIQSIPKFVDNSSNDQRKVVPNRIEENRIEKNNPRTAPPHPLKNENEIQNMIQLATPNPQRKQTENPRAVDLSKINVSNNGQTLDEPAKHKLWNKLCKLWDVRGWRYSMIQSVFEVCAKEVSIAKIDGDLFPYFEKSLTNYCNQNSEVLTTNSRKV